MGFSDRMGLVRPVNIVGAVAITHRRCDDLRSEYATGIVLSVFIPFFIINKQIRE